MPQGVSVNQASLPGDNRALEPPDSIPNSEVKRRIADGSVGLPHVRVGHRQAPKPKDPCSIAAGVFWFWGGGQRRRRCLARGRLLSITLEPVGVSERVLADKA